MPDLNRIAPHILTATDFGKQSKRAFFHALSLAVAQQGRMTLLHIGPESRKQVPWDKYPGVRDTLVEWELLDSHASRNQVAEQLGLSVKKMAMRDEDAYNGMVDYLRKHPTDLLVMATEARRGLARLRRASIAQAVAYSTHSRALLIPEAADDLVNCKNGRRELGKVMFVYDHEPDPRSALTWLNDWLPVFSNNEITVDLLYVGDEEDAPEITLPRNPRLKYQTVAKSGPALKVILEHAEESGTEVIAMMNQHSRGLVGRLRGSLNEQVLRRAGKPVLLLPVL